MLCFLLALSAQRKHEQQCSSEPYYIYTGDISQEAYPEAYKHQYIKIIGKEISLKEKAFFSAVDCLKTIDIYATKSIQIDSLALGSTILDSIYIFAENSITADGNFIEQSTIKSVTIKAGKEITFSNSISTTNVQNFTIETSDLKSLLFSAAVIDYLIINSNKIEISEDTFSSTAINKGITLISDETVVIDSFATSKFSGYFIIYSDNVSILNHAFQNIIFDAFEIHPNKKSNNVYAVEKSSVKTPHNYNELKSNATVTLESEAFYQSTATLIQINSSYCLIKSDAFKQATISSFFFYSRVHLSENSFSGSTISSLCFVDTTLTFDEDPFESAVIGSTVYQGGLIQLSTKYEDEIILNVNYGVYIKSGAYSSKEMEKIDITAPQIIIDKKAFCKTKIEYMKLNTTDLLDINYKSFRKTQISGDIELSSEKVLNLGSNVFEDSKFKSLTISQSSSGNKSYGIFIKEEAFQRTTELVSVIIQGQSVHVEKRAFDASSMLNLNISAANLAVEELAFRSCSLLLLGLNGNNVSIGRAALKQCEIAALYVDAIGRLRIDEESCAHTRLGIFHVRAGSISLGMKALMNVSGECVNLHSTGSIELGTMALSDTRIERAFVDAGELSMGGFTFQRSEIAIMEIHSGKTLVVQQSAFLELPFLRSLRIEGRDGVSIQPGAVRECKALNNLSITAGGFLTISSEALYRLEAISEINLTAGGNLDIQKGAFRGCTIITAKFVGKTITFKEASLYEKSKIGSLIIEAYGDVSFASEAFSEGVEVWNLTIEANTDSKSKVRGATISFGSRAFEGSTILSSAVVRTDGEINVGESAFDGASALGHLVLRSGVKVSIGREAFHNCQLLSGVVVVPLQNAAIDESAFEGCPNVDLGKRTDSPDVALIAGTVAGAAVAAVCIVVAVVFAARRLGQKKDSQLSSREA